MKIAINTRFLLPDRLEGIGRVTYELSKRLVEEHPDDEFVFLFDRPYDAQFVFGDNVQPLVLFPPARHPFLWWIWFEIAVSRTLRRIEADVFLSPDAYLSLSAPSPTVMITHDIAHVHYPQLIPGLVRRYYDRYVPLYLQRADRVITVSDFVKKDVMNQYGIAGDKIEVVYNACRDGFQPLDMAAQQKIRAQYAQGQAYFLYLGAIHPRKNIHRMIAAFDRFKAKIQQPFKLLISGRLAWQTAAVKAAQQQAQYQSDIHFLGFVPDEDLKPLLAAAYASVLVSSFEGFGLPILEAFHCDVPVITADRTALPEVAGAGGILVNPDAVEEIAEAMYAIVKQPGLRAQLVAAARLQRSKFSWDRSAAQVYDILKEVAGNSANNGT